MEVFGEIYDRSIKISRNLIEDIRFSREINLEPVRECSEQICQYLSKNMNILMHLKSVQGKYPYLFSHSVNVALISFVIGKWLKMDSSNLPKLVLTGMLHDIGKAKVRDSILNKPEELTANEMKIVKAHTILGYKILVSLDIIDTDILSGVLSHHERQNGSGYPSGLMSNRISLFSRIIAVADTYDAITSTRAYRTKSSPFKAVEEIEYDSFRLLDPVICHTFMSNISNFYYGSHVRLNNEQEGVIVYVNPEEKTKPLIRCENQFFNLTKDRNLEIVDIL